MKFTVDAILVSLPIEMYNDAMSFLETARCLEDKPENLWFRWRYLRASILFSFCSFEAFLNSFVKDIIKNDVAGVLGNPTIANEIDELKLSWVENLGAVSKITGKKTSAKLLQEAERAARIRNRLVHYSGNSRPLYENDEDGINEKNAERAIQLIRDTVINLKDSIGEDYPYWIKRKQSWIIS